MWRKDSWLRKWVRKENGGGEKCTLILPKQNYPNRLDVFFFVPCMFTQAFLAQNTNGKYVSTIKRVFLQVLFANGWTKFITVLKSFVLELSIRRCAAFRLHSIRSFRKSFLVRLKVLCLQNSTAVFPGWQTLIELLEMKYWMPHS